MKYIIKVISTKNRYNIVVIIDIGLDKDYVIFFGYF